MVKETWLGWPYRPSSPPRRRRKPLGYGARGHVYTPESSLSVEDQAYMRRLVNEFGLDNGRNGKAS
jgi:hypothetical protein